jgi:hypothetical protein
MRRIQIYIEEQLDEQLGSEAARAGVSKAALIREAVALRYGDSAQLADPLDGLVGSLDIEPGKVDDVVYGPSRGARRTCGVSRRKFAARSAADQGPACQPHPPSNQAPAADPGRCGSDHGCRSAEGLGSAQRSPHEFLQWAPDASLDRTRTRREIVVKPKPRNRDRGRIQVVSDAHA